MTVIGGMEVDHLRTKSNHYYLLIITTKILSLLGVELGDTIAVVENCIAVELITAVEIGAILLEKVNPESGGILVEGIINISLVVAAITVEVGSTQVVVTVPPSLQTHK